MSKLSKVAIFGAAGLLLTTLPVFAKKTSPKVAVQTVRIENTGSTNTQGYEIEISQSGSIQYHRGNDPMADYAFLKVAKLLPKPQTKKLFADLDAAMPFSSLPVRHGMRSASFGTMTYVMYKGQKSPDLTFASDPRTVALKTDVDSIIKSLPVENVPRHPIVIHSDR